ncbi:hypothetical protein ACQEUU_19435 [Nonomuraea sp. CA-218870]|uniref:hypothetical protein n=1 Tax=Nonomuraea sp. CA-218870 TaxID=3239998 RepID=UPI003D9306D3
MLLDTDTQIAAGLYGDLTGVLSELIGGPTTSLRDTLTIAPQALTCSQTTGKSARKVSR